MQMSGMVAYYYSKPASRTASHTKIYISLKIHSVSLYLSLRNIYSDSFHLSVPLHSNKQRSCPSSAKDRHQRGDAVSSYREALSCCFNSSSNAGWHHKSNANTTILCNATGSKRVMRHRVVVALPRSQH